MLISSFFLNKNAAKGCANAAKKKIKKKKIKKKMA